MESEYIKFILQQIKEAIEQSQASGFNVGYPKDVTIERDGIKITIPFYC
jgi:hypothetical protein